MRSQSTFFGLLKAGQLGSASLLAVACVAGAPPATAQGWFFHEVPAYHFQGPPDPFEVRRPEPRRRVAPRRSRRPSTRQTVKQPAKVKEAPPPGPHMLIVSVKSQNVSFYANGKLVSQSPVSTGKPTHPTPHGVFSIIQRNRHHRSNIYSGAPMPYMQRLTWSGIALHQGTLPGRPASHGCIRLPEQYASYLWRTIRMNTRVIVAREDVAPFDIAHPLLFQPKPPATVQTVPGLRKTLDTATPTLVHTASMSTIAADSTGEDVGDKDTKSNTAANPSARDLSPSVERLAAAKQFEIADPVQVDESAEPATGHAAPDGTASIYPRPADIPDTVLTSFAQSLEAKQKKAPPKGAITVFISKKEKRLYVRQHFIPLFSAPVTFKDDKPNFGTHVFSALKKDGSDNELRWIAVTLPQELPKAKEVKTRIKSDRSGRRVENPVKPRGKADKVPTPIPSLSAAAALDGIEIASEVVDRISEYITAGASLIVSDHGLGQETGLHTDFIVVTR